MMKALNSYFHETVRCNSDLKMIIKENRSYIESAVFYHF